MSPKLLRRREQEASYYTAKAQFTRAFASAFNSDEKVADVNNKDVSVVLPGLLLAGRAVEANSALLVKHGVTHILQVGVEVTPTHPGLFTYKSLPLYDLEEQDIVAVLPECFEFIRTGLLTGAVLVHCVQGVSRSAAVVIAYVMVHTRASFGAARALVKAVRPAINPNLGFVLQLQQLEAGGMAALEAWQPWSLERFLDAKEHAAQARGTADDRTLQGACKTVPLLLQGRKKRRCNLPCLDITMQWKGVILPRRHFPWLDIKTQWKGVLLLRCILSWLDSKLR